MRFLLDASADFRLLAYLTDLGHNVATIAHDHPQTLDDVEILAIALADQRVLITNDRDFGELIFRRRLPHAGGYLFPSRKDGPSNQDLRPAACAHRLR